MRAGEQRTDAFQIGTHRGFARMRTLRRKHTAAQRLSQLLADVGQPVLEFLGVSQERMLKWCLPILPQVPL